MRDSPLRIENYIYKNFKSCRAFAKEIDVCPTSIIHWFNGKSLPSAEHILKIHKMSKGKFSPNYWYLVMPDEVAQRHIEKKKRLAMGYQG